jgi:hypothetical protein
VHALEARPRSGGIEDKLIDIYHQKDKENIDQVAVTLRDAKVSALGCCRAEARQGGSLSN